MTTLHPLAGTANLDRVLRALHRIRLVLVKSEYQVHEAVKHELTNEGLRYEHEYVLSPGNRVDFLIEGGVAVEVKKGKPNAPSLERQVRRYAESPLVTSVIMLVERNVRERPTDVDGKPVEYVSLSQNWGVSL